MSRDPLVMFCMAHGLALDRETYIALAYPQCKPNPWTAEHEAQLPEIFREPRKWALTGSSGSGQSAGRILNLRPSGYERVTLPKRSAITGKMRSSKSASAAICQSVCGGPSAI